MTIEADRGRPRRTTVGKGRGRKEERNPSRQNNHMQAESKEENGKGRGNNQRNYRKAGVDHSFLAYDDSDQEMTDGAASQETLSYGNRKAEQQSFFRTSEGEEYGTAGEEADEPAVAGDTRSEANVAAEGGANPWTRRAQGRRAGVRAPTWYEESELEDAQTSFQRGIREVEEKLKSMVVDQTLKTEASTKKAVEAMAKEQEKYREELKASIEGSMKEMRAQIDTLVKSMVQLADAVRATRGGQLEQDDSAAEAVPPRQPTPEGGSPTPPGEGSLTPAEVILETQATPKEVYQDEEGSDPMATSEAVRRTRDEEPREGRSAERRHKKSKNMLTSGRKGKGGRSRSRSNEE